MRARERVNGGNQQQRIHASDDEPRAADTMVKH